MNILAAPGSRFAFGFLGLLAVGAVAAPLAVGGYLPHQLATYLIFGLFGLSVALVTGYGRLFNIGVGGTFGVAAYAVALLSNHGLTNPFLLLISAVLSGALISLLFGLYAILASGLEYLMLTFLTTLALFEVPLAAQDVTGGENGLQVKGGTAVSFGLDALQGTGFYWLVLGVTVTLAVLSWLVVTSQAGQAMRAIGRNPVRAAAMGYSVSAYRVALTLYAGFVASVAGWLYALQAAFVFQDLLGPSNSLNGLVYALIGGVDSIVGPLLGAAGLRFLSERLSQASTQSSLYVGVVLLLVVFFIPEGLAGRWRQIWLRRKAPSEGQVEPDEPGLSLAEPENETAL